MVSVSYTCQACDGEFIAMWTMEEAQEEAKRVWGEETVESEEMAQVCDNCYKRIIAKLS